MAKCPKSKLHKDSWRIKKIVGKKRIIFCLACEFEWESESKQYEHLPMLTEKEKREHLVDMYD